MIWTPSNSLWKLPLGSTLNDDPINTGLVGYWLCNEGGGTRISDLSSNNRTLTVTNAIWGSGSLGAELVFDGNGDYASTSARFDEITATAPYSIVLWIRPGSVGSANFICSQVAGTADRFTCTLDSSNKLTFGHYDGSSYAGVKTTQALIAGKLYHVVLVHTASKINTIWLDNVANSSAATPSSPGGTARAAFRLGTNADASGSWYLGSICVAGVYNRDLTPGEIAQLYWDMFRGVQRPGLDLSCLAAVMGGEETTTTLPPTTPA
ncbi:MAG: LamG domain-containing protein, partial [Planctomycetaceae bacterium]